MKIIIKALIVIFITLALAEGGLRFVEAISPQFAPGNESGKGHKALALKIFVQSRINKLWMRSAEERKTILEPPFQVFVNKNFQDQERMDFIFKHSPLPPNMNVTAENFLRLNDLPVNETFTATINSLSFRDPERTIKKPKGTFRIIVLGSYPAFGHAVNDHETYSYILEKALNEKFKGKIKFEVWNGGRQGGTSIMGYSRLINEVQRYNPDLVLWDYGWIELYLSRDRVRHNDKYTVIKQYGSLETKFLDFCIRSPLSIFKLCQVSVQKATKISYSDAISGWRESMNLVMDWSVKNKIPVVYLRHEGVTIPAREYEAFHNPDKNFHYVDTSPSLIGPATNEEIQEFWSRKNWISELNFDREKAMKYEPKLIFFGDAIQYNKLAYKRIGIFLSDILTEKDLLRRKDILR